MIENRGFLRADVIDKPLTYTVLIEIKDNEGERPTVRLSSCDSDVCSAYVFGLMNHQKSGPNIFKIVNLQSVLYSQLYS